MQLFLIFSLKKNCRFRFNYYIASLNLTCLLKKYGYEKRFKPKDYAGPDAVFSNVWL